MNARSAPVTTRQPAATRLLVVQLEEPRVVIAPERPPLRSGPGQGDEGRVVHRALPGLGQRPQHALRREVRRLGPEAEARSVRAAEDDLEPDSVRCGGLGLLESVGGEMRRVGQPREQLAVGCDEHLAFENVGHGAEEIERLPRGAREVGRRRPGGHRSRHADRRFWRISSRRPAGLGSASSGRRCRAASSASAAPCRSSGSGRGGSPCRPRRRPSGSRACPP